MTTLKSYSFAFIFFAFSLFLFQIPPIYPLPIYSDYIISLSLARYALFFSFLCIYFSKDKKTLPIGKYQLSIILLFFITQSLSIISTVNVMAFAAFYKDIVFSYLLFFLGLILINSKEKMFIIIHILFIAVLINVVFQFGIYFHLYPFYEVIKVIANERYWNVVVTNAARGKYFIEVYSVCFLPLLGYFAFLQQKKVVKTIYFAAILCIVFFAFVSGFRIHIIIIFFGLAMSILLMLQQFSKKIFPKNLLLKISIVIPIFIVVCSLPFYISQGFNNPTIERIISPEGDDYSSLESRFWMWQKAYDMGVAYPFFGVGLGNYYDSLQLSSNVSISVFDWKNQLRDITVIDPHNIFFQILSETGFIGLLSFILLITMFIVYDYKIIVQNKFLLSGYLIISFWSLFLFVFFNPAITMQYLSAFWIMRAIIIQSYTYYPRK